jgi:hypothetical protein
MAGHLLHRAPRIATGLALTLAGALLGLALTLGAGGRATAQTPSSGKTVTAIGSGQVNVNPQDRHNNASNVAAVEAAEAKAVPQALADARGRAAALAKASGLTLGTIESVEETPPSPFGYFPGAYPAPFGKDRYCGDERRPIVRRDANGRRRVVGTHTVHVCRPPRFVLVNLSVKFAAT